MAGAGDDIEEIHRAACQAKQTMYVDPGSGFNVFTAFAHTERGYCCGNGCRHCPYGHYNVDPSRRTGEPIAIPKSVLLTNKIKKKKRARKVPAAAAAAGEDQEGSEGKIQRQEGVTESSEEDSENGPSLIVLFWSGGKDSFLTVRRLQADHPDKEIVLLTTHDATTGTVAFQNTKITDIMAQAKALGLNLLVVPLLGGEVSNKSYDDTVKEALGLLNGRIEALAFGDLHLQDIREWREKTFQEWKCLFPLFGAPYPDLQAQLWDEVAAGNVSICVTSVMDGFKDKIALGKGYDKDFINSLPEGVDKMGEEGEFHTHVTFLTR